MFTLMVLVTTTVILSGCAMVFLHWAFHSRRFAPHRIREPVRMRVTEAEKWRVIAKSAVISTTVVYGSLLLAYPALFVEGPISAWTVLWQALAVLLTYDFLYYALHRWVFHHRKLMRYVHVIHHRARYPSAPESIYLHPAELVAGIALLLVITWLIGPVHVYAFGVVFLVYSLMNVFIHSGILFPRYPLKIFNLFTRKHYGHHMLDAQRNYGSITPIWDMLFGTDL